MRLQTIPIIVSALILPFAAISQPLQFLTEFEANDHNTIAEYGTAVAVSGNYALVGAPKERFDENGENEIPLSGAVYIYQKNASGNWSEVKKLLPDDRGNVKEFGRSVALWGNIAVVGAPRDNRDANGLNPLSGAGSAYIFMLNSSGEWIQIQKLSDSYRNSNAEFGYSVAVQSGEVVVGNRYRKNEDENGEVVTRGGVLIYKPNNEGVWINEQILLPPLQLGMGQMGTSVAVHGNQLIAGAPVARYHGDPMQGMSGAGCIFNKSAEGIWSVAQVIYPAFDTHDSKTGFSVAVSDDYVVMGAPDEAGQIGSSIYLSESGAVVVYKNLGGGTYGFFEQINHPDRKHHDKFGYSVALQDGIIMIGAPKRHRFHPSGSVANSYAGEIFVTLIGAQELGRANSTLNDSYRNFGSSIATGDGQIIIGAPKIDSGGNPPSYNFSGSAAIFNISGTVGRIFLDLNEDCNPDLNEYGLPGFQAFINPGGYVVQTNDNGYWYTDQLTPGQYTITSANWLTYEPTCELTQSFEVFNPVALSLAPHIGYRNIEPCAEPQISIAMPLMRPCFENQVIIIQACNGQLASAPLIDPYVDVTLHPQLIFQSVNFPSQILDNGVIRIFLTDVQIDQCIQITMLAQVSCDTPLGLTLCMEAALYPYEPCMWEVPVASIGQGPGDCSLPYDHSDLRLSGSCSEGAARFEIANDGTGNMACPSVYSIYRDGDLYLRDTLLLQSAEVFAYEFDADGRTWHILAEQHPEHPLGDKPKAYIEACGNLQNWTPGLVSIFPENDDSPLVDIYCGVVTGSYDPNDKNATPTGVGPENCIRPNVPLDYLIRFQNTGTDTAFTVVIVDTLSIHLNPESLKKGAASHDYSLTIDEGRILTWTFNNILLPDSNINESLSHGFVSFKVSQAKDLPDHTSINNTAHIYFDFNEAIITNTVNHTIKSDACIVPALKPYAKPYEIPQFVVYPNPSLGSFTIDLQTGYKNIDVAVFDLWGRRVFESRYADITVFELDFTGGQGVYTAVIQADGYRRQIRLSKL